MTKTLLSEQVSGSYHSVYENIISQIVERNYAIADHFFKEELIEELFFQINALYKNDALKKAAIGKHFDEHIKTEIRGDYIQWIDENSTNSTEKTYFQSIYQFVEYLNRTCFYGYSKKRISLCCISTRQVLQKAFRYFRERPKAKTIYGFIPQQNLGCSEWR